VPGLRGMTLRGLGFLVEQKTPEGWERMKLLSALCVGDDGTQMSLSLSPDFATEEDVSRMSSPCLRPFLGAASEGEKKTSHFLEVEQNE